MRSTCNTRYGCKHERADPTRETFTYSPSSRLLLDPQSRKPLRKTPRPVSEVEAAASKHCFGGFRILRKCFLWREQLSAFKRAAANNGSAALFPGFCLRFSDEMRLFRFKSVKMFVIPFSGSISLFPPGSQSTRGTGHTG